MQLWIVLWASLFIGLFAADELVAAGPRLKIITGGDLNMIDNAQKVIENQRNYAERHGYDFEVHAGNYAYPWTAYWHKIFALLRELKTPTSQVAAQDVTVWMDLDVVVSNPPQKMLESILAAYPRSAIILTEDPQRGASLPEVGRAKRFVNTGIILVRHRLEAIHLLEKLFMYGRRHGDAAYQPQSTNTLHEQDAFNWLLGGPLGGMLGRHAAVVPQRRNELNLNTFARNFYDAKYKDPVNTEWVFGDFTAHCSGLGLQQRDWCVDDSIAAGERVVANSSMVTDTTAMKSSRLGLEVAAPSITGNASNATSSIRAGLPQARPGTRPVNVIV